MRAGISSEGCTYFLVNDSIHMSVLKLNESGVDGWMEGVVCYRVPEELFWALRERLVLIVWNVP
jgi:hypothetical protein